MDCKQFIMHFVKLSFRQEIFRSSSKCRTLYYFSGILYLTEQSLCSMTCRPVLEVITSLKCPIVLVPHFANEDNETQKKQGISGRRLLVNMFFLRIHISRPIWLVETVLFQHPSWCWRQYDLVERVWLSSQMKSSPATCQLCHQAMYLNLPWPCTMEYQLMLLQ